MTPDQLSATVRAALGELGEAGQLTLPEGLPEVSVERPRTREHGDYATSIALRLAKQARRPPREIAEQVAQRLRDVDGIDRVDVAGPGFVNITLTAGAQGDLAKEIVAAGPSYGTSRTLAGERVDVEFVSANPTGPLHIGGVRWAAVGDALARILEATGAEVTREYYFNDHGAQIDRFIRSLVAAANGAPTPEDGYAGGYVDEIAGRVLDDRPDALTLPHAERDEVFREIGVGLMFDEIKRSLHAFGVAFDVYFHEDDLHTTGAVARAVDRLGELGATYEKDGALWLRSSEYGDDRDRVLVRSDGTGSYLSGDVAYYLDKRARGFERCLIILGADHHGYVGRMRAVCAAFGDVPGENLEILIGQLVNLLAGGEPLRMSKRAGTVVTIDDLVDAIGVDAARYALVRYSIDSPIDLDLDLWARRTSDNPVFYVQYAHARVSALLRNAADLSLAPDPELAGLLTDEREGELLRALADYPDVVAVAARLREPHRVARHLEEVAGAYHRFYDHCRVLPMGEEPPTDLHRARLLLVAATQVVLSAGLGLLGVSAPERM